MVGPRDGTKKNIFISPLKLKNCTGKERQLHTVTSDPSEDPSFTHTVCQNTAAYCAQRQSNHTN